MTDHLELLATTQLFEGLAAKDLESLRPAIRARTFERGAYLFREGDPGSHLHMVLHGQVKIGRIGQGGGEVVFAIAGPGVVFGELSLFDEDGERSADAQALEPTECLLIAKGPLLQFLKTRPELLLRIIAGLTAYIKRKDATIGDVTFLDIPGRVATKLVELADTKGRPASGGISIDFTLSQQTLAAMVGATRESVNRALHRFSELGYIRIEHGAITLLDREQLVRRGS
ncbi:MAG TPA: Crp/Fnr family transcriptional regulator [Candidatus Dormibacteraeota bacterium]|nr:Crp/Fnr family transcriptional regulator [Candidatus Dormibacteraeota bacterium]